MTLEEALRAQILADPAIAAVVGTRVYPRQLPQQPVLPAITYTRVDTARGHEMSGPDQLPKPRMQVTPWAADVLTATNLAALIRKRLDGTSGMWSSVEIGSCLCVGDRDLDDPDTTHRGVALDFAIQYREV